MFSKKKEEKLVGEDKDTVKAEIPVFFGGVQLGLVLKYNAKEVMGQEHMDIFLRLEVGSGIRKQIRDVLIKQGLYIGRPLNDS